MPILTPTELEGTVRWLGLNRDRAASLESEAVEQVTVDYGGFVGESHGGLTRPSCSRVKLQYPKGTEIKNARQITILSTEEIGEISKDMGLPSPIRPEWIGANMILQGVPQLTQLPPGSRLIFENGTSIAVDMENGPCKFPAEIIEQHHPGKGLAFPKHAMGKRGITAWIEREGEIKLGDVCVLHVPPQRIYEPAVKRRKAAAVS
ncbi:MAG: MOSC domain-containing protein [Pseudomonadota bacterium]